MPEDRQRCDHGGGSDHAGDAGGLGSTVTGRADQKRRQRERNDDRDADREPVGAALCLIAEGEADDRGERCESGENTEANSYEPA
jgi:hypothetical protein